MGLQAQLNAAGTQPEISWHACRSHQAKPVNWTKKQVEEERLRRQQGDIGWTLLKKPHTIPQKSQIPSFHCCPLLAEGKSPHAGIYCTVNSSLS